MNMLSTEVETSHDPEGYDVPAVEAWIRDRIDGVCTPLKWTRLLGGHSNLTYRVDSQNGLSAVIRRPPRGELLPKAHDMGREWAVITALAPTAVPVPQGYAFCEGPDVTGAWFYLMELIDGHPLYNLEDTNEWVPQSKREQLACSFIDILADLHALDPDEIGLGDLGKKEGYVARQVRTWYRSWMSSIEAAQYDDDRAHELQRFFIDNMPEQGKARLVHPPRWCANTATVVTPFTPHWDRRRGPAHLGPPAPAGRRRPPSARRPGPRRSPSGSQLPPRQLQAGGRRCHLLHRKVHAALGSTHL